MEVHKFFHRYANVPLADRETLITHDEFGQPITPITLREAYARVQFLQDKMRDDVIERDRILRDITGALREKSLLKF